MQHTVMSFESLSTIKLLYQQSNQQAIESKSEFNGRITEKLIRPNCDQALHPLLVGVTAFACQRCDRHDNRRNSEG